MPTYYVNIPWKVIEQEVVTDVRLVLTHDDKHYKLHGKLSDKDSWVNLSQTQFAHKLTQLKREGLTDVKTMKRTKSNVVSLDLFRGEAK